MSFIKDEAGRDAVLRAISYAAIAYQVADAAVDIDQRPAWHPDGIAEAVPGTPYRLLGHPLNDGLSTSIVFDASIREEHGVENTITDSPVEDGGTLTDHIRTSPTSLTMEVIITPHKDVVLSPLISDPSATIDDWLTPLRPDRNVLPEARNPHWQALVALARSRQPFDVTTSLAVYENMVISRLSTPRTNETGDALFVSVSLRQIEVARTRFSYSHEIADPEWDIGPQGTTTETASPRELSQPVEVGAGILPGIAG